MRKLTVVEWVSLDGVMEAPETWASPYSDDEMQEVNQWGMAASDALLMGRVTYEVLAAYWSEQPDSVPIADYINNVSKLVVSTTLVEAAWRNSALIRGDVAEEVAALKRKTGKDITILGSAELVRSLLRDDLIDELTLLIHPVVLGSGKRLFEDRSGQRALKLASSRTFGSGVVSLTYEAGSSASPVN